MARRFGLAVGIVAACAATAAGLILLRWRLHKPVPLPTATWTAALPSAPMRTEPYDAPDPLPAQVARGVMEVAENAGVDISAEVEPACTWKAGGPQKDGTVLFVDWDGRARIMLLSDYGFVMVNDGPYNHPKPVYLLGFRKRRQVTVCRSFMAFEAALRQIPRASKVYHYGVCTCGTAPGVHEADWRRVARVFRRAHLRYSEETDLMYDICGEGADPLPNAYADIKDGYVQAYGLAAYNAHHRAPGS